MLKPVGQRSATRRSRQIDYRNRVTLAWKDLPAIPSLSAGTMETWLAQGWLCVVGFMKAKELVGLGRSLTEEETCKLGLIEKACFQLCNQKATGYRHEVPVHNFRHFRFHILTKTRVEEEVAQCH